MANSNFIDYVKIYCRSGKGGKGSTHFHREKFIPKGGPDGGDGGRGGHIILKGNKNYWTLLHLKYAKHIFAGDGGDGGASRSFGKDGADKIIEVPCGTVVYDADTGEFLCDVTEDQQEVILIKGGRGGLGNWHFRTATNQTPRFSQPGEPRVERNIIMQLKVLADVGLVGFPNAGKSTLLNALTHAGVLEEDKLFATLDPTTRALELPGKQKIYLTDTVGFIRKLPHHLIEAFKSTLEEAKYADVIIHVVDASNPQMDEQMFVVYQTLKELGVQSKKIITLFNKQDKTSGEQIFRDFQADYVLKISAKTGEGLEEFKQVMEKILTENQIYLERNYGYQEAGKIQLIRKYGQLLAEEYTPEGIYVKARVPASIYGKIEEDRKV